MPSPQGFRLACSVAMSALKEIAIGLDETDPAARRTLLERCAGTALNSKLISAHKVRSAPCSRAAAPPLT